MTKVTKKSLGSSPENAPLDTALLSLSEREQTELLEKIFSLPPPKRPLPKRELMPIDLKKYLGKEYQQLIAFSNSLAILIFHNRKDPKVGKLLPIISKKLQELEPALLYSLPPLFDLYILVLSDKKEIVTEQLKRLFFLDRDKRIWFKQGLSLFSHLLEVDEINSQQLEKLEKIARNENIPPAKLLFASAALTGKFRSDDSRGKREIFKLLTNSLLSKFWFHYQRLIADWVYPIAYTLELALSSIDGADSLFSPYLSKILKNLEKFPWDKTGGNFLLPSIRSLRAFAEPFQCWNLLEPIFNKIEKNPNSEKLDSFFLWYSELLFKLERRAEAALKLKGVRDISIFTIPEKLTASFLAVNLEEWKLFNLAIEELEEFRIPYLFYRALAAVKLGKNSEAIELLEELLGDYPSEHQARSLYWAILEANELREKLIQDCEKFSKKTGHPLAPIANTIIATQLAITGEIKKAKEYFERVSPSSISRASMGVDFSNIEFRYYASFALCCEELGELERALQLYRKAFELEPYEWLGLRILSLLTALEKREEADELYLHLKELYPENYLLKFYGLVKADRTGNLDTLKYMLSQLPLDWFEKSGISEVWYYFQIKILVLSGQMEQAIRFSMKNLDKVNDSPILREFFSLLIESLIEENIDLKAQLSKKSKELKKYTKKNRRLLEKLENIDREKSLIRLMETNSQVVQRELSSFKPVLPFDGESPKDESKELEGILSTWIRERDDLFSPILSDGSRELLISAKRLLLESRRMDVQDWGPPVTQLARVLERELNRGFADLFAAYIIKKKGEIPPEGSLSPLKPEKNSLSLGELYYLLFDVIERIEEDGSSTVIKNRYSSEFHRQMLREFWSTPPASNAEPQLREFFSAQLPLILQRVREIRNRASHGGGEFLKRQEAEEFFSLVLGSARGEGILSKILQFEKIVLQNLTEDPVT